MASALYKANLVHLLPVSAASTNATSVATASVDLFAAYIYNGNAAVRYLKLYNLAVAPTVGTSVPVMTIALPPSQMTRIEFAKGLYLSAGLAFALTTGAATADTGAVSTDLTGLNLVYSL